MPKSKDLKRLVRARMKKSGESYTAARRQILSKKLRSKNGSAPAAAAQPSVSTAISAPSTAANYAELAGLSDAAVLAKTGRDWRGWVEVLDAIGATKMAHRDIAKYVHEKHGVPPWWTQAVTVGYERIRGLREKGQRMSGSYEASKSRTFAVPLEKLYHACRDAKLRAKWLPGPGITVRKATPFRSLRIRLADDSPVEFWFVSKGAAKSTVQIQQGKLPTKATAEKAKALWAERLDALKELLDERRKA